MSKITTPSNIPGSSTSASVTNTVYSNIAAGTSTLDSSNTQTEWCSFKHLSTSSDVFNSDFAMFSDATNQFVLTTASDTVITLGANPMRLNFAPSLTLADGERIRVHADINVDDVGQINLPNILDSSQDCFYLTLYYRNGLGIYTPFSSEWGYSVTNYTDTDVTVDMLYVNSLQTQALRQPRRRFRCSVTGFIPGDINGIDRIELRARLDTVGVVPSVTFEDATLCAFVVRR